jgi:hypothetical protein
MAAWFEELSEFRRGVAECAEGGGCVSLRISRGRAGARGKSASDVGRLGFPKLTPTSLAFDRLTVDLSIANSALSGIAAAQTMFDVTAQAAARVGPADAGSNASAGTTGASGPVDVDVAVLRMALDSERSLVDILA